MTAVDEIMMGVLSSADLGHRPARRRAQLGADPLASLRAQSTNASEAARITPSPEQIRARRARSIAVALALGSFVLLIYAVTIVKVGSRVLSEPDYMRPVQAIK
jgi:ferric-dicitrate binding protein FerR (iron transport regulator)